MGASAGAGTGGLIGSQSRGDHTENILKGAVIGGVVGGLLGYATYSLLEDRDTRVRRETLLNLEKYDVYGRSDVGRPGGAGSGKGDACYRARVVDDRELLVPCRYTDGFGRPGGLE